jgi:DNA-binding HxlR family transcriptional regulator
MMDEGLRMTISCCSIRGRSVHDGESGHDENRARNGALLTFRCKFLMAKTKKNRCKKPPMGRQPTVKGMVEDIIGCKWSLTVLALVRDGVSRPGAMEHAVEGLSAKVLNERLRKLMRFGILERTSYAEIPPRVEYSLTPFGTKLGDLLDRINALEDEMP